MATSTHRIQFSVGESPSVDELAGGLPGQPNVLVDAAKAVRMRPGISAWSEFPDVIPNASPVIGQAYWGAYLVYVCQDRTIWALLSTGNVAALSSALATTKLDGTLRPVFCATRSRLVIAGGGKPQKWEGAGLSARLGGNPPNFSHVTTISRRLVGNDSGVSGLVYWSEVDGFGSGHEDWSVGSGAIEAESRADPVVGLYQNSGEIVALGTESIQMLSPDPSAVFSNARTLDVGWGAPLSYVQFDDGFFGLDARDRAVMSDGRALSAVSSPNIGETLGDATSTADAWGMRYQFGNYDLGILTLPTDGRSFAYDKTTRLWSEWYGYNAANGALAPWSPTSSCYWPAKKLTLVGLPTGQIAKMDKAATADLGTPIVVQMTSTFDDHGTTRLKTCKHVRLTFHRGIDAVGGTATARYDWRDSDRGPFQEPVLFAIGDSSDADPTVLLNSPGQFRQRQHRITVQGVAWRFVSMEVDVEATGI